MVPTLLWRVIFVVAAARAQLKHIREGRKGGSRQNRKAGNLRSKSASSERKHDRINHAHAYDPLHLTQMLLNTTVGHSELDICTMERFFCKVPSGKCASGPRPKCVKQLFITATAGSGTHYVSFFLKEITRKGITVMHESPAKNPDVLVSWPSRCPGPARRPMNLQQLGFTKSNAVKPPMLKWANSQLAGQCAFRHVVHLVRHPLKFLSSNFAFGQCLECWALVEHLTLPPIKTHTKAVRQVIEENRLRLYAQTGGRTWDTNTRRVLLQAFMLYWVTWNEMIALVADERVRIEDADLHRICSTYGLGSPAECGRSLREGSVEKVSHGGSHDQVTWDELDSIDKGLSQRVWELARSYGYDRDPPSKKAK